MPIRIKKAHNSVYVSNTLYIYICWPIIFEGDPKVPISIAILPRCRGESYSFPCIAPLTLDLYFILLSFKQGGIKYHFWVFGMTRPRIEPWFPRPWTNTLRTIPLSHYIYIYIYIYRERERDFPISAYFSKNSRIFLNS